MPDIIAVFVLGFFIGTAVGLCLAAIRPASTKENKRTSRATLPWDGTESKEGRYKRTKEEMEIED